MLTPAHQQAFENDGYVVVRSLFTPAEIETYKDHFMALRAAGPHPGDMVADVPVAGDPLQKFPRMIHMHRWDELSRRWMLDQRLNACLTGLFGREPYAVQTMLYFKPPGSRGQALHQDDFYLQTKPGMCMAAWMALDRCDEENGCMQVIPGSHRWPIVCAKTADSTDSFTNITTPFPEQYEPVPVVLEPGDVLFFGGSVVHGSFPNRSEDRFRRSLIAHYVDGRATELTQYDQPVLRMSGEELMLMPSPGGAPCGVWTEDGGQPSIAMTGRLGAPGEVD